MSQNILYSTVSLFCCLSRPVALSSRLLVVSYIFKSNLSFSTSKNKGNTMCLKKYGLDHHLIHPVCENAHESGHTQLYSSTHVPVLSAFSQSSVSQCASNRD